MLEKFPDNKQRLDYRAYFTAEEYACIAQGFIPTDMEDKWTIRFENGLLFFCRSWTGFCIFLLSFKRVGDGYEVDEAWVNRDPAQYLATDASDDVVLLQSLIVSFLLKR